MRFKFQQSKIWEAGNPVEPNQPIVTVKVKNGDRGEARARRKLPTPEMGRVWVLVGQEE